MIILILIGFISGIISGMGIGGGAVLIPCLLFFAETPQHQAQAVNLIYFIPTAISALYIHIKNKSVDFKVGLLIAVSGIAGAIFGAYFAAKIDANILKKCFACFLIGLGLVEIFKKYEKNG